MLHAFLLLEDDDNDAKLVCDILTREYPGIIIQRASTLAEALQVIRVMQLDIAIVDLSLPDARGLKAVFAIREEAPTLPVLVLTGMVDPTLETRIENMPACRYMEKGMGVDRRELQRHLRQLERDGLALRVSQQGAPIPIAAPPKPWYNDHLLKIAFVLLATYGALWLMMIEVKVQQASQREQIIILQNTVNELKQFFKRPPEEVR